MTTPVQNTHAATGYSGQPFGDGSPKLGSKAWRLKKGLLAPKAIAPRTVSLSVGGASLVTGQDSVVGYYVDPGCAAYGAYYDGPYPDIQAMIDHVGTSPVIISISPYGSNGARCIDIEPGDAIPADAPQFYFNPSHNSGQKDAGKPIIYCTASDAQAVLDYMANAGIARDDWYLWSAHWIGYHICHPDSCGFPEADGTQYASNSSFDSNVWYAYMFQPPAPTWPLEAGDTGSLVNTLQVNLNRWASYIGLKDKLVTDSSYGPATTAAVVLAQEYFSQHGVTAGVCTEAVYESLEKADPGDVYYPVEGATVDSEGTTSVKVTWSAPNGPAGMPAVGGYDIAIAVGDKLEGEVTSYPRYVPKAPNPQTWQGGSLKPKTGYTMGIRAVDLAGGRAGPWVLLHFETSA